MKLTYFLTILFALIFPALATAETPNRVTMSFEEFVNASGCVIVDKGGYSNLAAVDGGNCPFAVTVAWNGPSTKLIATAGPDETFGTDDDGTAMVSDN